MISNTREWSLIRRRYPLLVPELKDLEKKLLELETEAIRSKEKDGLIAELQLEKTILEEELVKANANIGKWRDAWYKYREIIGRLSWPKKE